MSFIISSNLHTRKFLASSLMIICSRCQVVNEPADVQCPVVEMSTRSKLSCLSWNKYTKNNLASSDYEGIVTVWDVTTRQVVSSSFRDHEKHLHMNLQLYLMA